jgi:hypothetical protein
MFWVFRYRVLVLEKIRKRERDGDYGRLFSSQNPSRLAFAICPLYRKAREAIKHWVKLFGNLEIERLCRMIDDEEMGKRGL